MRYFDLKQKLPDMVFTPLEVAKFFPVESADQIKIQLARFAKRNLLTRLKRGLYVYKESQIDELALAGVIYQPSYVSLESALFYYGIIPDITQRVTSVTTITTKEIKTNMGIYSYAKVEPKLFFGYSIIQTGKVPSSFYLAEKEKALLDYFYLRKIQKIEINRFNFTLLNMKKYRQYASFYPEWTGRIL
jgi:predicted transcriptional regulator of viral defense system